MRPGAIASLGALLDVLCPMHLIVDAMGRITHAGPTARKVLNTKGLIGCDFLDLFEVRRPRLEPGVPGLRAAAGRRLHCVLRGPVETELKGVAVPLPEDRALGPPGGVIVDLSFGIGVMDAVGRHDLRSADFAVTDLAVEMLYLVEAKAVVTDAWQKLNQRLQGAKAVAEQEAHTDTLTGLGNRRALEPAIRRLTESEEAFTLMHLDLDFFKSVNDTLGHAAGDHVLRRVAQILREEIRKGDTVIRVGGDEFVLILVGCTSEEELSRISGRLIERLEEPVAFNGEVARISGSIGTTRSGTYATPRLAVMMDDADLALYAAKQAGRGCHKAFAPALRKAVESRPGDAVTPV
ncbi:diguanylate cyclase domain-containing protein [Roseovarius confluentis]|uniref:diguanylate cyclase domain-containing protein n=1 Tax=Roseovarius confluentis TaxID=1852027 RepID=UPI000CDE269A|nr:diguanylate cyclase [Roseovarius confluentis]